ncbi:MAG: hypothetical protein IH795_11170, partial [Bacteroidetes bacterium]|nr:hypothetical protein [Bacteroidota bacterium]
MVEAVFLDFFGIIDRKKSALKREIQDILNSEDRESSGIIQDWDTTDQTTGRNQRVSYRTLEQIYKRESWVRAAIDAIYRTTTSNGFRLVTKDISDPISLTERETKRTMALLTSPNPDDSF